MKDRFPTAEANTAVSEITRSVSLERRVTTMRILSAISRIYTFAPDATRRKGSFVRGVGDKRPGNAAGTLAHARVRAYCGENSLVSPWERN